jgi:hypothetical protein
MEAHEGYTADMDRDDLYIPTELPTGDATEGYLSSFIDLATFGQTFDWYDPLEGLGREGAVSL